MRRILLVFIGMWWISAPAWSQVCSCYANVDSTWQVVPMTLGDTAAGAPDYQCNNCSSSPIALPFHFCFYGKDYDTVYINTKGSLTFGHPAWNFSSDGLPKGADTLMLGAFLGDVDDSTYPFSFIYYKVTPTHLLVQWNTVAYNTFDPDIYNNFQVIITNGADTVLPPGNNVSYCYWLMRWASSDSSGGSGGFGGVSASVGVNKGDGIHYAQFGIFDTHGYTYYGPFDSASELYWLDDRSFTFNTCVSGNTIPPVIVNPDTCMHLTVCAKNDTDAALDTLVLSTGFLCPQKGQKATVTETAPGLLGVTTDTISANSIYYLKTTVVGVLSDTGTYTVTITATDNSTPPLTNSIVYSITVQKCDTATGIAELKTGNPQLAIYPNPSGGIFTVQSSVVSGQWSVGVYNVLGEKVYSRFLIPDSPFPIDLSSQPSGVYFCRLTTGNGDLIGEGKLVIAK